MIADELMNWEKAELANTLADKYLDTEDLLEAMPDLVKAESFEASMLEDYIELNWEVILRKFDIDEICCWLEEREDDEALEQWYELIANEEIEADIEYQERLEVQRYQSYLDFYAALGGNWKSS